MNPIDELIVLRRERKDIARKVLEIARNPAVVNHYSVQKLFAPLLDWAIIISRDEQ